MPRAGGKAVFHVVVAFAGDRGKTDSYHQCAYSVVKQQIPKFMGNGEISMLSPPRLSLVMLLAGLGDLPLLWLCAV